MEHALPGERANGLQSRFSMEKFSLFWPCNQSEQPPTGVKFL